MKNKFSFNLLCSKGGEKIYILLDLLRIQRRHRHLAPVIKDTPKVWFNAGEVLASSLCIPVFLDGLDDVQESFCRHVFTTPKLTVDVGQQLKFHIVIKLSSVLINLNLF